MSERKRAAREREAAVGGPGRGGFTGEERWDTPRAERGRGRRDAVDAKARTRERDAASGRYGDRSAIESRKGKRDGRTGGRKRDGERKRDREWNGRRRAGWGKRPKLPWRPATNCRRPRLRAARYSRPSVRAREGRRGEGGRRGGSRGSSRGPRNSAQPPRNNTAGPESSPGAR